VAGAVADDDGAELALLAAQRDDHGVLEAAGPEVVVERVASVPAREQQGALAQRAVDEHEALLRPDGARRTGQLGPAQRELLHAAVLVPAAQEEQLGELRLQQVRKLPEELLGRAPEVLGALHLAHRLVKELEVLVPVSRRRVAAERGHPEHRGHDEEQRRGHVGLGEAESDDRERRRTGRAQHGEESDGKVVAQHEPALGHAHRDRDERDADEAEAAGRQHRREGLAEAGPAGREQGEDDDGRRPRERELGDVEGDLAQPLAPHEDERRGGSDHERQEQGTGTHGEEAQRQRHLVQREAVRLAVEMDVHDPALRGEEGEHEHEGVARVRVRVQPGRHTDPGGRQRSRRDEPREKPDSPRPLQPRCQGRPNEARVLLPHEAPFAPGSPKI
jgi:hypothetical protein